MKENRPPRGNESGLLGADVNPAPFLRKEKLKETKKPLWKGLKFETLTILMEGIVN